MSKFTKIWLIIAASLVIIGAIIFAGVMTVFKWDFRNFSTLKQETNTYEISESYKNISIITDTANITFIPTDAEKTSVICKEHQNLNHSVTIKDGTLTIELTDSRKWYQYFGNFGGTSIEIYIPQQECGALSVRNSTGKIDIRKGFSFESIELVGSTGDTYCSSSASGKININRSTGDIHLEGISADSLELSCKTGKIYISSVNVANDINISTTTGDKKLNDITCKNLTSKGSTSDITLSDVVAESSFNIKTDTGDVKFDGCDAAEIFVKTDTGKVTGSLLSDKIFFANTDTGKVDVPKSLTGGRCEITTDTGDISISIKQ
jgi:DUF4097 and DUF4098 domain-containing protein YvlB